MRAIKYGKLPTTKPTSQNTVERGIRPPLNRPKCKPHTRKISKRSKRPGNFVPGDIAERLPLRSAFLGRVSQGINGRIGRVAYRRAETRHIRENPIPATTRAHRSRGEVSERSSSLFIRLVALPFAAPAFAAEEHPSAEMSARWPTSIKHGMQCPRCLYTETKRQSKQLVPAAVHQLGYECRYAVQGIPKITTIGAQGLGSNPIMHRSVHASRSLLRKRLPAEKANCSDMDAVSRAQHFLLFHLY